MLVENHLTGTDIIDNIIMYLAASIVKLNSEIDIGISAYLIFDLHNEAKLLLSRDNFIFTIAA